MVGKEQLRVYFNFLVAHWLTIKMTNSIESVFATVRLRTNKTQGMMSGPSTTAMMFMICQVVAGRWHMVPFANRMAEVVRGVKFIDRTPAYAHESVIAVR